MVLDSLDALLAISNELAELKEKPPGSPKPPPEDTELHPDLVELLSCGAYTLKRQGISLDRIEEYTNDAAKRGLRRKVWVFGWPRRGDRFYATPERPGKDATVLIINRLERLATTEVDLEGFVQVLIEATKQDIERIKAKRQAKAEAKAAKKAAIKAAVEEPKLRGRRQVKVRLPDTDGVTVVADGEEAELAPDDFAYIRWTLESLGLVTPLDPPDLTRWERRAVRAARLDAKPAPGDEGREAWEAEYERLTRRDRAATSPNSHQLPSWKLSAPGHWLLAPTELELLRRIEKAHAPRHKPNKKQKAILKRWNKLLKANEVELRVH